MYYPNPWYTTVGCSVDQSPHDCRFGMQVPYEGCKFGSNRCSRSAGRFAWFTNYTWVEEETLPEGLYSLGRHDSGAGLNPWSSPGAAPVYGNGCGLNGGNPDGCDREGYSFVSKSNSHI